MEELSFFEKLVVLYENFLSHPLFVLLFLVPIVLLFLQKKHGKKIFVIAYFLVIFVLLISFGDIIFKLFDNLMDGLFMFLYFPNFITLFLVVVICSLIALVSLLGKKINKVSKVINYVSFGIVQTLFSLILITVRMNKINIYKDNALYTNKDVLTLMQLLIGAFSIQVLSIVIIKLINKATNVLDSKANISSNVMKQVNNLSKTKIKPINIDNNKVGFINIADKSLTSRPLLKPFKFDINKIESIHFSEYLFSPKAYSILDFPNQDVTYSNELLQKKLYNRVDVDYNKNFNLNVLDSIYKNFKLDNRNFYYLNEVIKRRKLKPVILDSNKFVYLKIKDSTFKKVILENNGLYYLNENRNRDFRIIKLDSNRIVSLNIPKSSFKILSLDNRDFSYLNSVPSKGYSASDLNYNKDVLLEVPKKDYNISSIDSNKSVSMDVLGKSYSNVSLEDKDFGYLNNVPSKGYSASDLNYNKDVLLEVPKKDYNISSIDSSKSVSMDVLGKSYSNVSLEDKDFGYLNNVPSKGYSASDLNYNKDVLLEVPKKDYNISSIDSSKSVSMNVLGETNSANMLNKDNGEEFKFDDSLFKEKAKPFDYLEEKKINDVSPKPSLYDKMFNSKPEVDNKPLVPFMVFPKAEVSPVKLIDNLQIIDVQSTLDTVIKCNLMKNVHLRTYEKITVSNLNICNFKLLSDVVKKYKIVRKQVN